MKKFLSLILLSTALVSAAADAALYAKNILPKVAPGTITYKADNGWLYNKNELTHLAKGKLADGKVALVSACKRKNHADPRPALKAFNDDLAKLGIKLIVVPVPPKMAAVPCGDLKIGDAMANLKPFYQELREQGLTVLDISEQFKENSSAYYCKTDSHWNTVGIALTAGLLAKEISLKGSTSFSVQTSQRQIAGDLAKSLNQQTPATENITLQTVHGEIINEKSQILLIGDSHTLIFSTGSDMLAEKSGLAELLAVRLNMPIDRIGIRGSAATAVRINLFRKTAKNPEWLKNKKYIIYCFSCREFTEATSGWVKVPVLKK